MWCSSAMATCTIAGVIFALAISCLLQVAFGVLQSDVECLTAFKTSVQDPQNQLVSWVIPIKNPDDICKWKGVDCYGNNVPPMYRLNLPGLYLSGTWPEGLRNCSALQQLDLSSNNFTGPIPSNVCTDIPNLVSLNIANNKVGGVIPVELSLCKYLNDLLLQNNFLEGEIPAQIGPMERLKSFNVSYNDLSGLIPSTLLQGTSARASGFPASSFTGNAALCGAPLATCGSSNTKKQISNWGVILGGGIGGFGLVILAAFLLWYFMARSQTLDAAIMMRDEGKWAKQIRNPRSVTVTMFEKPIVRIKLSDLMLATNNFSKDNIIGAGRTGTVYLAAFPDGSQMAIKRLRVCSRSDRQFKAEIEALGHLRHRNLVPLLGYCVVSGERLLVYKHMPNGCVWTRLHTFPAKETNALDWAERVKIATGAARGLTWLHHGCNPRVVHRTISSHIILLDDDNEPRITDFGLARLINPVDAHMRTLVNGEYGEPGYVAPEVLRTLVANTKGDVYSFGVILLELVTGQKPLDVEVSVGPEFSGNLVDYVLMLTNTSRVGEGVDQVIRGKGVDDEILEVFQLACSCVLLGAKDRPSMVEVYQVLRAIGEKYNYTDPSDDDLPALFRNRKNNNNDDDNNNGGGRSIEISISG